MSIFFFNTSSAWAVSSPKTRCDFYKSTGCAATGCYDATTKAWSIIDWEHSDYSLCDINGCQHYPFSSFKDGIYVSLTFPKREVMFKINLSDNSAVETSTMLNYAFISFGNCARVALP
jgi:hypothetical protein